MYNPVATYRIQFRKEFSFEDFGAAIPYLRQLGIRTLYASPVFASTPGSSHGYDGIDPHRINPEIGTEEALRRISGDLKQSGIGWLQDIVPNHMAFHPGNAWLMDVLEKGRDSAYASFFDIGWESGERLMVPFLGSSLEDVIAQGQLRVVRAEGRWVFDYFDNRYPLNEASVMQFLQDAAGDEGPADPGLIRQIADAQHYRLCHWQETDRHINFRRFFTVNGLICLNIQDDDVFRHFHSYTDTLLKEGVFSGLRIDHIDGLYDPTAYLESLRSLTGPDCYTVVEKILEPGEDLPAWWPIQGNTGYDFLSLVNNLFTRGKSEAAFTKYYRELVDDDTSIHQQLRDKKAHILYSHMAGELENLAKLFISSGLGDAGADVVKPAIGEFLIQCPVYRYYGSSMPLGHEEAEAVSDILAKVRKSRPGLAAGVEQLETALLIRTREGNDDYNRRAMHFYRRCMQFTGPLMAKGVEDTLMYTYNRFIGHNDVGDSPESFGITREAFHKAMLARQARWPLSINTTSTHDTKRGEDARAMLNVLTHMPDAWLEAAASWQKLNAGLKEDGAPDAADEYFIYQTLVATYPFDAAEEAGYPDRLKEYLQKALREGKRRSDWAKPDEAYEAAVASFASALLDHSGPFWQHFTAFRAGITDFGMIGALAQLVLKATCPGVPDIYQGTELWDLSLVDPDNRRPVDFALRAQWLKALENMDSEDLQTRLWEDRRSGRIKLWLTHRLLQLRFEEADLFSEGHYVPLRVTGTYADHVIAFGRRHERRWIIAAVPLHLGALEKDPLAIDWKDTAIMLPPQLAGTWQHLLGGGSGTLSEALPVKEIFDKFPLAILRAEGAPGNRSAGVLMPVSSLPSAFGIGDFGPEARRFARQLSRAGQGYWQLLPLNPISAGSGFSPYSSISTMAGNPLLVSPDLLVESGLADEEALKKIRQPATGSVDYETAERIKSGLLDAAYERYKGGGFKALEASVDAFVRQEASWLEDFARYVVLKRYHDDKPWYEWPDEYRLRREDAIADFSRAHAGEIEKVKWQQAVISDQWQGLRAFCNSIGVKLVGDLPFYASYDSADVWTHPDIFSVDEGGKMTGVAGVPPDYFSETGQLWGMPTFKWEALEASNYSWWIDRLRKNLQLYDLLRIDHFRALAAYWEVPAGEETAVNGRWIPGPGTRFFDAVREAFGGLPFIAEDLGDNMEDVYKLRDAVGLPGMKIMQFAFGDNLPTSVDAPHNYGTNFIAYTGTHDNNTTLGWYRKETSGADRKRLERYTGCSVDDKNVVEVMARLVYGSVARIAILPMQDVLRLDERARMNTPSSGSGNWAWRMERDAFSEQRIAWLQEAARFYNRI